jgi:hypothetical protein
MQFSPLKYLKRPLTLQLSVLGHQSLYQGLGKIGPEKTMGNRRPLEMEHSAILCKKAFTSEQSQKLTFE